MAASYTAAQSLGTPSIIVLTDASTDVSPTVTNRKVYLRTSTNKYLYETQQESSSVTFTNWPISDGSTINLDVLTEATTLEITVIQTTGAGTTVEEWTDVVTFTNQDYIFMLGKIADQTSSPGVLQDQNYYNSLIQFIVNLNNAEVAAQTGDDLYSSQQALNRNQIFINDEDNYF